MKTRILHTKFWQDSFVITLSKDARLLFIWALTNQYINICGTYEVPDRVILIETGLSSTALEKAKEVLNKSGKVLFVEGWIVVFNVEKYNTYRNSPKNETAYQKEIKYIPSKVMRYLNTSIDTSTDTSIHTSRNHKSKIINHKSKEDFQSSSNEREELIGL